jgi:5,10-methylenetetrahydromethanopterin reductase
MERVGLHGFDRATRPRAKQTWLVPIQCSDRRENDVDWRTRGSSRACSSVTSAFASAPRIGVMFPAKRPVAELPAFARRIEQAGYDELWLAEDCFLHGGLTAATAVLAGTERLAVGIGLLPVAVRNPAIAAMELATLAELYPGRTQVAFGHGVASWMRQIGARPADRIVALRETMAAVRALLQGEEVSHAGRFVTLDRVRLEHPPAAPPALLVGTTGERAIGVAAAVGDGVLLPEGASAEAVAWAGGLLGDGATLVTYAWLCIDEDGARVERDLLPAVARWRDGGLYGNLVARAGAAAAGPLDTAAVRAVAVSGSAEQCAEAVTARASAGASSVVLTPVGERPLEQLEQFAAHALPRVAAG